MITTLRKPVQSVRPRVKMSSEGAQTSEQCVYCHKDATRWCEGCNGAPGAQGGKAIQTRYCDKACQDADWATHKRFCKACRERKVLYRAGATLQLALYLFQEHFWYLPVERKELTDDTEYFHQKRDPDGSKTLHVYYFRDVSSEKNSLPTRLLRPFPNAVFPDRREKEAILVYSSCSETLWCMHSMITYMIEGTQGAWRRPLWLGVLNYLIDVCRKIQEIVVDSKNDKLTIIVFDSKGEADLVNYSHQLIKATTKSGESFALDLTGSQYGYDEPVIPWTQYVKSRLKYCRSIDAFGNERRQVIAPEPGAMYMRSAKVLSFRKACAVRFEESLNSWTKTNGTLDAMVKLPENAFLRKRTELLSHLEASMEEAKESLGKHVL